MWPEAIRPLSCLYFLPLGFLEGEKPPTCLQIKMGPQKSEVCGVPCGFAQEPLLQEALCHSQKLKRGCGWNRTEGLLDLQLQKEKLQQQMVKDGALKLVIPFAARG